MVLQTKICPLNGERENMSEKEYKPSWSKIVNNAIIDYINGKRRPNDCDETDDYETESSNPSDQKTESIENSRTE